MKTSNRLNRREHERMRLNHMYTSVIVEPKFTIRHSMLGHAYDISDSGIRIELDEPLEVGQSVTLHLDLPGAGDDILADADVAWVNDEHDDPGPRRMALRFTQFHSPRDHRRLTNFLSGPQQHMAA